MDESDYGSIGFMFDSSLSRQLVHLNVNDQIELDLYTLGDDPGHLQSGQYLWPAAMFGSNYIINNWSLLCSNIIIELGSGCGLCGIVSSKMNGVEYALMTDYDPGALEIINKNINININKSHEDVIYQAELLEWGIGIPHSITAEISRVTSNDSNVYNMLIIGTDLLYSVDIVEPLVHTVNEFLRFARDNKGVFILVSSFDTGENIKARFNQCVIASGLVADEIVPLNVAQKVCRVHHVYLTK